MEADVTDLLEGARQLLRDFPQFFEADLGNVGTSTIRLPHPNVDGPSVQVFLAPEQGVDAQNSETVVLTPVARTDYTVDQRNGLLKFKNTSVLGKRLLVAGYHFEWFIDDDLAFYAGAVVGEHLHGRDLEFENMDLAEVDVVGIGVAVRALWSLVTQFSTEINVSTPEGMNIPANQRFQQVWQLLQYWESEYTKRAGALNVGFGALRVFELRRVSLTTGRLVPIYKPREYDDYRPPRRLIIPVDSGVTTQPTNLPASYRGPIQYSVEEIGREGVDLGFGGWRTIATRGDYQ